MPDWITHAVAAYLLAAGLRTEKKSLVVLGGLLPDLLTKLSVFFRYVLPPDQLVGFEIFHTPLIMILVLLVIAPLFSYDYRKSFLLTFAGTASHFALDSLQGPVGYMFLWPFSWQTYTLGVMWSENPVPMGIALIIAAVALSRKLMMKNVKRSV